jgi:hypothetical protein
MAIALDGRAANHHMPRVNLRERARFARQFYGGPGRSDRLRKLPEAEALFVATTFSRACPSITQGKEGSRSHPTEPPESV